jgi:hypothetical protein
VSVQAKFNAIIGSNTRPRGVFSASADPRLLDTNVYFDRLEHVADKSINAIEAESGALYWEKKVKNEMYIKCKEGWVSFSEVATPIGKFKTEKLRVQILKQKCDLTAFKL